MNLDFTHLNGLLRPERVDLIRVQLVDRLRLLGALHGCEYAWNTKCPGCQEILHILEVLQGFSLDPQHYHTKCVRCRNTLTALLSCKVHDRWEDHYFLSPAFVLLNLKDKASLKPEELRSSFGALYHSAMFLFGTLRAAFALVEKEYEELPIEGWEKKIDPFLGLLPDTCIAECVGIFPSRIRSIRKNLKVSNYKF